MCWWSSLCFDVNAQSFVWEAEYCHCNVAKGTVQNAKRKTFAFLFPPCVIAKMLFSFTQLEQFEKKYFSHRKFYWVYLPFFSWFIFHFLTTMLDKMSYWLIWGQETVTWSLETTKAVEGLGLGQYHGTMSMKWNVTIRPNHLCRHIVSQYTVHPLKNTFRATRPSWWSVLQSVQTFLLKIKGWFIMPDYQTEFGPFFPLGTMFMLANLFHQVVYNCADTCCWVICLNYKGIVPSETNCEVYGWGDVPSLERIARLCLWWLLVWKQS